jgi:hypothetical protein
MVPTVSGSPDSKYLRDALARAGAPLEAVDVVATSLTGGRTASQVTRLQARTTDGATRDFVLKIVPPAPWREALGMDSIEARLWLSGVTRALPSGLRCPTVDVANDPSRAEWWILMDDVSAGIAPRGSFDENHARTLMRHVARMHASYWGCDLEAPAFDTSASALATLSAHVARRGNTDAPRWLESLAEDFKVPGAMVPALLDALDPRDADFFVALCGDHARIARALERFPRTLCHGDLRRANISFAGDDVALFDWEFASCGPAARDLQWYAFLQFWAYPPAGERRDLEQRSGWLDAYVETLEHERSTKLDRVLFDESCDLAWLSVFCQIGCCLADPLTDERPSAEAVANARRVIGEAIERARRIHDRHVR